MPERIYLSPPDMSARERALLLEAFDSGWVAPVGPHLDRFEAMLSDRAAGLPVVALSSGTAALELALRLLGVERGDRVWCSTLTFVATANAILAQGATPVFVDSNESWNLCPERVEAGLREAAARGRLPKALIAVDLYGECADYPRLRAACDAHGVALVEDAAEALGATLGGRPAGCFGHFGVFSFNGNKVITTSGGGALVCPDAATAERARYLATQARQPVPHYEHTERGYNFRLSNLLAAVGCGQLERLDELVAIRRAHNESYRSALAHLPGFSFMPTPEGSCWLTALTVDPARAGVSRDDLRLRLEAEDIEARPVWKPMHLQPMFVNAMTLGGAPAAAALFRDGLCLPSGSALTEMQRARIIELLLTTPNLRRAA